MFCDEVKDVDFKNTTKKAMKVDILNQVSQWINAQPSYIKVY